MFGFCNTTEIANELRIFFSGKISNLDELCSDASMSTEEALLCLYNELGVDMLYKLQGDFAFAICGEGRLFCARDIFGAKPFYYAQVADEIIFGNDLQKFLGYPSFVPVVNTEALGQYLTFQYSVLHESFFEGVYKLPPAHYLLWQNNELITRRYHSLSFSPTDTTLDDAVEEIDNVVTDSVEKIMQERQEEVGSFLSGGVDSSYIAALYGKNGGDTTFTVGFDYERYNEIEYAKSLSDKLGLKNISKLISTEEYWEALPKIQACMGEPLADPAAVAFYFACKEAAGHVKTALSGEAADEFFGGYNIYKEPLSLQAYTFLPRWLRKIVARIAVRLPKRMRGRSFLLRGALTVEERFVGNAYIFSPAERSRILKYPPTLDPTDITRPFYEMVKNEHDVTKMQFLDIHLWLADDILLQAEKMSAAHGLELRVPLLNRKVFSIAASLPVWHKVSKRQTKIAFRKAAAKHLPPETATRKKLGFPVPIRVWLREEKYYNIIHSCFTSSTSEKYFHVHELLKLLDEHFNGKQDNSRKIWTVYMFLLWHEEVFT